MRTALSFRYLRCSPSFLGLNFPPDPYAFVTQVSPSSSCTLHPALSLPPFRGTFHYVIFFIVCVQLTRFTSQPLSPHIFTRIFFFFLCCPSSTYIQAFLTTHHSFRCVPYLVITPPPFFTARISVYLFRYAHIASLLLLPSFRIIPRHFKLSFPSPLFIPFDSLKSVHFSSSPKAQS